MILPSMILPVLAAAAAEPGPAFTLDLDAFRRIDPALRLWREAEPIRPGWTNLAGVAAAPDGSVLAVGGMVLARFGADGRRVADVELPEPATCLAVASDGAVAVGLKGQILLYDAALKPAVEFPHMGRTAWLASVAFGPERIAAGDAGQRVVWLYDRSGRMVGPIGASPRPGETGFVVPSPHLDVLYDPQGVLWAVNPGEVRVEAYAPDGTRLRHWGRPGFDIGGFCGCCNPTDIALLPDGSFVTAEKGIVRVKVVRPDGSVASVVAGPDEFDDETAGLDLAVDSAGRILVADTKRGLIRVFVRR